MKIATSGYWNPLHKGHLKLLTEAKKLGDYLVVIVNNDKQVKLKGSIPFMDENERVEILRNIKCVDEVVLSIDEDRTVCKTLQLIKPDIFAKGGDSVESNVPEMGICKVVFGVGGEKIQSSSSLLKKRALVTGATGQDGSYMCELLLEKGYEVHATVRRSSTFNTQRIDHIRDRITLHYADMTDPFSLLWALKKSNPDEIYNFASQSHVQVSWEIPLYTAQTTGLGVLNLLEAVRFLGLKSKIYQASTSELFSGAIGEAPQNEQTKFKPVSPYASAKLYGHNIASNYREAFRMFICCGILFNHESPRRGDNFVTKKIINAIPKGEVHLGNIDASRDWGSAKEYVEMAWLMLQQDKPDDYVVATGETHSVREFIKWVEEETGKEMKVVIDPAYIRPAEVEILCGNPKKAQDALGWSPKVKGKDIVKFMLNNDIPNTTK